MPSRALEDLHPALLARWRRVDAKVRAKFAPRFPLVYQTLRSDAEQVAYFARGRRTLDETNRLYLAAGLARITEAENRKRVTNADGVTDRSYHQAIQFAGRAVSCALDVVSAQLVGSKTVLDWDDFPFLSSVGALAEREGLEWGGRFRPSVDAPHIQLPRALWYAEVRA